VPAWTARAARRGGDITGRKDVLVPKGRWSAVAVFALLLAGCGDDDSSAVTPQSPAATAEPSSTPTGSNTGGVDYVVNGVWHRADGTTVNLPKSDYWSAVMWDDRLVATRSDGEVFALADVVAPDGTVVETLKTTSTVVANDKGTTIAWVQTDGKVMTAWKDGRVELGTVSLAAAGESIAYSAAGITGGPSCKESDGGGCIVYLNSGEGKPRTFDSHGVNDNPLPKAVSFKDVSEGGPTTYVDKVTDDGSCSGLADVKAENPAPKWTTCDHTADQISPEGAHVIGLPAYLDGLGVGRISILDAATGKATATHAPAANGFAADWAWSADGRLIFDRFESGTWHLMAMTPTGEVTEIGEPVQGEDADSPSALIKR
jgi:hypothetical protein